MQGAGSGFKGPGAGAPACQSDPVDILDGEFYLTKDDHLTPDLEIPGRGPSIDLSRTYRSRFSQDGPLGHGWDFNMNLRLRQTQDGDVVFSMGNCREARYDLQGSAWVAPSGIAAELTQDAGGDYALTFPDGTVYTFDADGLIQEQRDRFGNAVLYTWSAQPEPVYGKPRFSIRAEALARVFATAPPSPERDAFESLVMRDYRIEEIRFEDPEAPLGNPPRAVDLVYDPETGRLASVSDWTGRTWTYAHDALGNLVSVTAPPTRDPAPGAGGTVSSTTSYVYGDPADPHNVTQIVSPELQGTVSTFLEQTFVDDRVTQQTLADGAQLSISYDPAGAKTTVTDGTGTVWEQGYDPALGRLTSLTVFTHGVRPGDPASYTTTYVYDTLGRLEEIRFPEGNSRFWKYPDVSAPAREHNNVAFVEERPKGWTPGSPTLRTSFTYEPVFQQIATITDPEGHVTRFFYDAAGNLERIEHPPTPEGVSEAHVSFHTTGQLNGQLQEVQDPNGNVTRFEYDPHYGYLDRVIRAFGSADEATTEFDPDDLGRPTAVVTDGGHTTALAYDALDRLETVTAPSPFGHRTEHFYDTNGNLVRTERDNADDPADGVETTTFAYDPRNRLESVTDDLGHQIEYAYDANGNLTLVEDAEGHATLRAFDERNLLYTVTPPAGSLGVVTFHYHDNGTIREILDGAGRTTQYDYDAHDRLETVTHEDGTTEVYAYDANGDLDTLTTRAGETIDFTFDARRQLRSRTSPTEAHAFTYDLGGRLATASNSQVALAFGYNARDELVSETVTALAGYPGTLPATLATTWDGAGNPTSFTHSDGKVFHLVPDALDRLAAIQDQVPTPTVTYLSQSYDDRSLPRQRTFASGATWSHTFDPAGRVDVIESQSPSSATLTYLDYGMDPTGSVDEIADDAVPPNVLDYGYDTAKQLTGATYPASHASPVAAEAFTYDLAGNREEVQEDGAPVDYVPNALNQYSQVAGVSYLYDDNGNLTDDGTRTFTFDAESRLLSATNGPLQASYAYDPFGRRIRKTVNDGSGAEDTWFFWLGDALREEHDASGMLTRRYVYANEFSPALVVDVSGATDTVYDVHADHLDTPRLLTDATGTVVWQADSRAFGEAVVDEDPDSDTSDVAFHLRFPGQYFDPETGLHYNWHRYYDPTLGRYVSADPIGQLDDENLFAYVGNNPLGRADPSGLSWRNTLVQVAINTNQGLAAFADGAIPFFDPFAAAGAYDPCDPTLRGSRFAGAATAIIETGLAFFLAAPAAPAAQSATVANAPIAGRITGYTAHGLNRAIARPGGGVSPQAILSAVRNPQSVVAQANGAVRYVGQNATVVLNRAGQVVTTWVRNSSAIRGGF